MMEKRYELLIIYLISLRNRFLLEIHYLIMFKAKQESSFCARKMSRNQRCVESQFFFCLWGGGGMIALKVTVHKSLTLFTWQAQGILLLGSVFSHLRKFLQKEIRISLRKNLRK